MSIVTIGDLAIDVSRHIVSCGAKSLQVKPRVCQFLEIFAEHPNVVIGPERLLSLLYGINACNYGMDAIRTGIKWTRRALATLGTACRIELRWGEGYELVGAPTASETVTFSEKQMLAFSRVLAIANKSRPDLVNVLSPLVRPLGA